MEVMACARLNCLWCVWSAGLFSSLGPGGHGSAGTYFLKNSYYRYLPYRRLGLRKTGFLQIFVTRPPKTCPLDQLSLMITNMVSDFAGDQYFCLIFPSKDGGPAF